MKGIDQRIADLPPEKLALLLERLGKTGPAQPEPSGPTPRSPQSPGAGLRPLSFAQERLWFLEQLAPGGSDYNVPTALRLRGQVGRCSFARAIREVVRRHEVLRTSFRAGDGGPAQTVEEDACLVLGRVDLSGLCQAAREVEAGHLARSEALRPFDLERAPLLRACWVDLAPREQLLLLTLHHIACDGWSIDILTRELIALYLAFEAGQPSPLPEPVLQYGDYVDWQRRQLQGERLEQMLVYWRRQLRGAPATIELRGALLDEPEREHHSAHEQFSLPWETSAALRAMSREERATPFMMFAALFSLLLHAESGQDDLCLGANAAHRSNLETEGLIGFFINQIVLRVRLAGAGSFRALLRHVRDVAEDAFAHQDLPFEKLVQALCPERNASRNPLFQVKVDFQDDQPPLQLPGVEISGLEVEVTPLRCDLLLRGAGTAGVLSGMLSYDKGRFRVETVRQMVATFEQIARTVAAQPDIPLRQVVEQVSRQAEQRRFAERERLDRAGAEKLASTRRRSMRL